MLVQHVYLLLNIVIQLQRCKHNVTKRNKPNKSN